MSKFVCQELIYRNDQAGVKVHKGTYSPAQIPVAIKIQQYDSLERTNAAIKEAMSTLRVHHDCICYVYDCSLEKTEEGYQSVIISEWMEGDILKEIRRRKPNRFWTNEEMRWYMYKLVEALASAQTQNVCHRDIKPQNVFYNSEGWMKIGDFGSSLYSVGLTETHTLQGSPFYLSPELKRFYIESGGSMGTVVHDPFRSDVYSLGLTFLQMARLVEPVELMDLPTLAQNTEYVIGTLTYDEDLKCILRAMLGVESRPDFTELYTWMQSSYAKMQAPEPNYQVQSQTYQDAQYFYPQMNVAQSDGQTCAYQEIAPQPEAEFYTTAPMEYPPEQSSGDPYQQPDEERKLTVCEVCGGRNSPNKKWRKYPSKEYQPNVQYFMRVCTLDCLDSLISSLAVSQPEESKTPAEGQDKICTLCQRDIKETDYSISLKCGHAICKPSCFVEAVVTALKKREKHIKCHLCRQNLSKKVFGSARQSLRRGEHVPIAKCLNCGNDTDRIAECTHPFCKQCGKILGIDFTELCILCKFTTKSGSND